jgi:hypothetical protein
MHMNTRPTTIAFIAIFGAALATTLGSARADSGAEADAFAAQAALSARYTELWTQMPAAARPQFSRIERHWLHVQRWDEQQRCQAAAMPTGATAATEIAARCLAQVTLQRLASLHGALPLGGATTATTASIAAR